MADNAEDSTSWWQWIANTAGGLYTAKLQSDVAIENNKATLAALQQQQNDTLPFLGYEVHKKTLLWIAGGCLLVVTVLVLLKRR